MTTSWVGGGVPRNMLWWVLQAGSAGLMVLGGVWGVRWREVKGLREFGRRANEAVTAAGGNRGPGDGGGGIEMVEQGGGGRRGDDNV